MRHVWFWRSRLPERKGQPCEVVARGAMNSIKVRFADGYEVITSRYAVRAALLLALALTGCAAYREAWQKDGACSVVCDYRTGYLSAARAIDTRTCRCITPELADRNRTAILPPTVPDARDVVCALDCATEAAEILRRHPWRAP